MKYLKEFAKNILKDEIKSLTKEKEALYDSLQNLTKEKSKLERKVRRLENPENIILSYYRIDNVGSNGIPPSYLRPEDMNEYTQRISELESVYRNRAFREMMAWSLNFHANMAVTGKIINELGDEIEVPTENAKHMISGIKAIWELVVAAHSKDQELTQKDLDPYSAIDIIK